MQSDICVALLAAIGYYTAVRYNWLFLIHLSNGETSCYI